jgi:hypothetical protein
MKQELRMARCALFLIYGWFGVLKIFSVSPASPLVSALLERTMPFIPMNRFEPIFGLFELAIGCLFLFPRFTRYVLIITAAHLLMTVLPLLLLPHLVWTAPFIPTLEGQYIIKNVLIVVILLLLSREWQDKEGGRVAK